MITGVCFEKCGAIGAVPTITLQISQHCGSVALGMHGLQFVGGTTRLILLMIRGHFCKAVQHQFFSAYLLAILLAGHGPSLLYSASCCEASVNWVAVKELNLSYHNGYI